LAFGSKENTVLLPFILILIEIAFFQDMRQIKSKDVLLWSAIIAVVLVIFYGLIVILKGDLLGLVRGYEKRPFTLSERLLTEPRIIVYYLSQIFYPLPTRFSIEHDVIISISIFKPWTTLPAILIILTLIVLGLYSLPRWPLLGFSILFFLINHTIESSIIPLELIFEHRNYLPSLFIFAPLAIGLKWLLDRFRSENRVIYLLLIISTVIVLMGVGLATYSRNQVWYSEKGLWEDAALKAPHSARPLAVLAWDMTYGVNAHPKHDDNALVLYQRALQGNFQRKRLQAVIMNNIAGIYDRKKDYPKTLMWLQKALQTDPDNTKVRFDLTSLYLKRGQLQKASRSVDQLLSRNSNHEGYLNTKGLILLRQHQFMQALRYFRRSLNIAPNFDATLMYIGIAMSQLGRHEKAAWFLKRSLSFSPTNMMSLIYLIENELKSRKSNKLDAYVKLLLHLHPYHAIQKTMIAINCNSHPYPISYDSIVPAILDRLKSPQEIFNGLMCTESS
jgi:Tfp pilus assembly protein PilF